MARVALLAIAFSLVACSGVAAAGEIVTTEPSAQFAAGSIEDMPPKATALCLDGTWSSTKHRQGACSGHEGVKTWFGKPPKDATARCKDGTYSTAKDPQGACSNHGGVAFKLGEGR